MGPLQEAIQKGLNEKKDWVVDTTGSEFQIKETKPEEKKEDNTPPPPTGEKVEDKKEVLSNSSQEQPKKEEAKPEGVKSEVKVPTFEELIAERTGGKIKDWAEIEAKLNEPKLEFANEQAQKINDYIKNGGTFNKEWLYLQTVDLDKLDSDDLIAQAMRLNEPGITDEEIALDLKTKYRLDEWSDEGEEPTDVEKAMSAKLQRDVAKAKQDILTYREKTSFSAPKKSEDELRKEATLKEEVQKNWEKQVEEGAKGLEKIPVKIDDKETFDVIVSKEEKDGLVKMANEMGKSGLNYILPKFLDEKGNINVSKMQNYFYKAENFDNAVKTAFTQGIAKGQLGVVKDIKNIKFNADGQSLAPTKKGMNEQIAEQFQEAVKQGMI